MFGKLFLENVNRSEMKRNTMPALVLIKKDGIKVNYSWLRYKEKVLQAMVGLKERNLKEKDFVAIIALNLPESFFIMLGAILMGAIPVPIDFMLLKDKTHQELKKILDDCRPSLVLGNQCLKKLMPEDVIPIEKILEEGKGLNPFTMQVAIPVGQRKPEEMLIMPYTSGTTGQPKGVMLSEEAVMDRVEAIMKEYKVSNRERVPSYLTLGHIAELVATFFGQIHSGYTIYFTEHIEDRLKNPENFTKIFPKFLQQVRSTIFLGVPKVWCHFQEEIKKGMKKVPAINVLRKSKTINRLLIRLVKKELGFTQTRVFITAAAPTEKIDFPFFRNLEINIDDIYGQTETGGPILINGKPIGNAKAIIGTWSDEILIKNQSIMLGYYNNPEATIKSVMEIKNGLETERTYRTGDAGAYGKRLSKGPGQSFTQVLYAGRLSDSGKAPNGEYYSTPKLYELEKEIKKIEGVEEVIICVENRPYLTALVFYDHNVQPFAKTHLNIQQRIQQIGEGYHKIKKFRLLDKRELILTPTLKVKKRAVTERFKKVIDQMYEND